MSRRPTSTRSPESDDLTGFRHNLKTLREAAGLSRAEFADRLGMTRQMVTSYETKPCDPGCRVLLRMAHILGCSVGDLLGESAPAGFRESDYLIGLSSPFL